MSLRSGFSLTELSISLTIIAIIAGSALSVALTSNENAYKTQTLNKLDKIEKALAGFVILNHRLPCPANGVTDVNSSSFGSEGTVSTSSCPNANFISGNVFSGVVPVRTLNLPDDFMFDGWGHRITYAVDIQFANNNITNQSCDGTTSKKCFIETLEDKASITVNDAAGLPRTTHATYALISHGENGHGAFSKIGNKTRVNAYINGNPWRNNHFSGELENSHLSNSGNDEAYNNIFVAKDLIKDEANLSEYFDDIVRFKTKSQIVQASSLTGAKYLFYDSICRITADIINNPINDCSNAKSESDCTNFAIEIYNRCIHD